MELLVYPAVYLLWKRKEVAGDAPAAAGVAA
jgi:hypothetical protein